VSSRASVRFAISSAKTGKRHRIWVDVFDEHQDLVDAANRRAPDHNWRLESTGAAFLSAGGFYSKQAPLDVGTILYHRGDLDIGTVVHEVVHAAMFIYSLDLVGEHSRALAHISVTNETIAYLIDDLIGQMAERLLDHGCYA
jgi:hypothetical protein